VIPSENKEKLTLVTPKITIYIMIKRFLFLGQKVIITDRERTKANVDSETTLSVKMIAV